MKLCVLHMFYVDWDLLEGQKINLRVGIRLSKNLLGKSDGKQLFFIAQFKVFVNHFEIFIIHF